MSSYYGQLDLFKHMGSTIDRKTLLTLNGVPSSSRNFKNYPATFEKTAFNITGFIQPAFVHQMLHSRQPCPAEDVGTGWKCSGILAKARGYTARLSMVLHYLEQATRVINDTASQPVWDLQITQAVNSAAAIIQHLNTQKLIMLSTGEVEPFTGATALTNRMVRLLMMESRSADWIIYPSEVAQKKVG